jgi:cytochrome c
LLPGSLEQTNERCADRHLRSCDGVVVPGCGKRCIGEKYACSACHTIDSKLVGPAFKEIAAKYREDQAAPAKLAEKVKKGSQGVWGSVPMPPGSTVPDADVNALVSWILSQ